MPVTTAANAAITEAQFEAQLRAAILAAFPWLPAKGLIHQKSFTFRFGKASVSLVTASGRKVPARMCWSVFKGSR